MAVAVLEIIEVTAKMLWLGQQVMNVWHFQNIGGEITDEEALDDGADLMEQIYGLIDGIQIDLLTYDEVNVRNYTDGIDLGAVAWPTLTAGVGGGAVSLPTQTAALLTFPTGVPKRRGRKFFPGFGEDVLTGGLWTSAVTDALEDIALLVLSNMTGISSDWQYQVVVPPTGVEHVTPSSALITNIPSTMGRRRIGRGQ